MLAPLIRQEFLDNGKQIGAIIGGSLVVGLASVGLTLLELPVVSDLARAMLFILGAFIPAFVLLGLAMSYWRTMHGSRGYFTHAIPVRGRELYWAKTLVAYIAGLLALLLGAVAMGAGISLALLSDGATVADLLRAFVEHVKALPALFVWLVVIEVLLSLASLVFPVASVLSIGAQGRWNRHGLAAPAIGLVLLYVANQIGALAGILLIPGAIELETGRFTWATMLPDFIAAVRSGQEMTVLGLGMIPMSVLLTTVMIIWGIRLIERHTSLR